MSARASKLSRAQKALVIGSAVLTLCFFAVMCAASRTPAPEPARLAETLAAPALATATSTETLVPFSELVAFDVMGSDVTERLASSTGLTFGEPRNGGEVTCRDAVQEPARWTVCSGVDGRVRRVSVYVSGEDTRAAPAHTLAIVRALTPATADEPARLARNVDQALAAGCGGVNFEHADYLRTIVAQQTAGGWELRARPEEELPSRDPC